MSLRPFKWEPIEAFWYRAPVPGGWLVTSSQGVIPVFIKDEDHSWDTPIYALGEDKQPEEQPQGA